MNRKPLAVPAVLKSFNYAQNKYPGETENHGKNDRNES